MPCHLPSSGPQARLCILTHCPRSPVWFNHGMYYKEPSNCYKVYVLSIFNYSHGLAAARRNQRSGKLWPHSGGTKTGEKTTPKRSSRGPRRTAGVRNLCLLRLALHLPRGPCFMCFMKTFINGLISKPHGPSQQTQFSALLFFSCALRLSNCRALQDPATQQKQYTGGCYAAELWRTRPRSSFSGPGQAKKTRARSLFGSAVA